ncbi:uncharacterized protein METZ01_LOCUS87381 [marine metagenome]|uniref:Uncharacterized protein n=1 Tax=marine metagenome TaxID=408172 RepID=A0A381V4E0_9ZZZZ
MLTRGAYEPARVDYYYFLLALFATLRVHPNIGGFIASSPSCQVISSEKIVSAVVRTMSVQR